MYRAIPDTMENTVNHMAVVSIDRLKEFYRV